ncbi:adenylate/guanylate cyclase domain-containing protein [Variovorax sp. DT-64]|uniref:adenylate/guanylate cyclase domain-containing protein n=1 Tax=Variovorax sp. DT-64 TaxID=3396160 RepID=UPI003F1AD0EF
MNSADLRQRLLAILAADAVGYSRLMARDEHGTVAALDAARAVFRSRIEAGRGRVIDMAGDSVLAVFETAAGAVTAAIAVQQELSASAAAVPQDRRMHFRIGIHMGDVIEKADGTVYGDGVNIASRLCAVAEAGGIVVSDAVHGAVRDRIVASFVDQGEQPMKNIAHLVHAFQLKPAEPAPPPTRALRPPDRPSLAVLPFTNMSGDPEQEYFADGITEDIITDCSKISGLFVIARNSTFTFKKQNVDIKDVGARLGVRHVLEGSVRRHGMRVRINVQLIDAESGGHVWADRYDRELEDIFLVQDEVTRKIVQTLEVRLTGNEEARRQERGKVNGEAYDYLFRAKSCILQFTEPALAETREMLERALTIDPDMAQAYAFLAIARGVEYANAWNGRTEHDLEESLAIARKACEADPAEPMAYHALSNAFMWLRRLDEAESAARRSLALEPNSAEGHGTLGIIMDFAGRHEEAVELLGQALRLDPQFSLWRHAQGRAQFALGQYAEAEVNFKRRLIQMPGSDVTRAYLASLYGHTGRPDEAGRIWRELMALHPGYAIELTLRVLPYSDPAPLDRFVAGLRKAGLAS